MNATTNLIVQKLIVVLISTLVFTLGLLKVHWPSRFLRSNAFGDSIPFTFGIVPGLCLGIELLLFHPASWIGSLVVIGFSIVGLCDDIYGSAEFRGIRGHISALMTGKVTTGLIKLVASPILATIFSMSCFGLKSWVTYLSILTVAASSNLFNLLDLRPGRSQGFAVLTLIGLTLFYPSPLVIGAAFVLSITLIPDSKALVMTGDSGAISIGATIGLIVIASSNITLIALYTAIAVGLNLLAERYSLGKLIAGNTILNKVDRLLGRRE